MIAHYLVNLGEERYWVIYFNIQHKRLDQLLTTASTFWMGLKMARNQKQDTGKASILSRLNFAYTQDCLHTKPPSGYGHTKFDK